MTKFIVEAKQLEELLNYLVSRPWAEVNNLIQTFSKLEVINEEKEEEIINPK